MHLTAITDQDRIEHFDNLLIALLGGQVVYDMLVDYYMGANYCQIAEKHGVARSTARGWITQAKMKLRQAGLVAVEPRRATQVQ